jgi:hypothetical protein
MLEELYNPVVTKVYWWRSRAFRIGLAIFVAIAVLVVVLFNQQIGNLLRSFGTKAANNITLTGSDPSSESYFFSAGYSATPYSDSFKITSDVNGNYRLMLNPVANVPAE